MNNQWPKGLKEINAFYGNPSKKGQLDMDWYRANITKCPLPSAWEMVLAWDTSTRVVRILVHARCAESLARIFQRIWDNARLIAKQQWAAPVMLLPGKELSEWWDVKTNEVLRAHGMNKFGGSFNFRPIRGKTSLSTHAYGCALDLDPEANPLGAETGKIPEWVVKAFKDEGWTWGGDFKSRKDLQHFQAASGY